MSLVFLDPWSPYPKQFETLHHGFTILFHFKMPCLCIHGGMRVVAAAAAWPCPTAASSPPSISATRQSKTLSRTSSTKTSKTSKMLMTLPWIGACLHPSGNRNSTVQGPVVNKRAMALENSGQKGNDKYSSRHATWAS